jgi:hypothetical protein
MLVRRLARSVGIDGNALRRRTDRVEAWLTLALAMAVLLGAPFLIWWSGAAAYRGAAAGAEIEQQRRFPVEAVLLSDAADWYYAYGEGGSPHAPAVTARWTAPDGTRRTGRVVPQAPGAAGTVTTIWTDRHGNPRGPRPQRSPSAAAVGAGGITALGIGCALACVLLLIRRCLNRLRMAGWERDWMRVEPRWSGRRDGRNRPA